MAENENTKAKKQVPPGCPLPFMMSWQDGRRTISVPSTDR